MKINMDRWSKDIIDSKDVRNLPVLFFPVLTNINMGVIESVTDSKNMAAAMKEVITEYPETIAAITGMDLTVDSEAFGAKITFSDKQAPGVKKHVLKSLDKLSEMPVPDINAGRQQMFADAIIEAQELVKDRPVFGGMLGPFSLAANLMEVSNALMCTISEPEEMKELLEISTDFLIRRAKLYKEKGANGIFVAEPTAGILSPEMLDEFSNVYVKKLVEAVQDEYFYLILHDCGKVEASARTMYDTGCKGFHFGNGVDMNKILPQIPADVLVFGNIDPSSCFFTGTEEEIYKATYQLLEDMRPYPHFVLSSGCDLAPSVTNENIQAYYKACRDFNEKNGVKTEITLEGFLD